MAQEVGWQEYCFIGRETTLGTPVVPGIWLPYNTFGLMKKPVHFKGNPYVGVRQRRSPNQVAKFNCVGPIGGELHGTHASSKSLAEWLLEWATNGVAGDAVVTPDGLTICRHEPNSSAKRWGGVVCNSFTLAGADGGPITWNADTVFMDQTDDSAAPALSATSPCPGAFLFQDTTFTLDGGAIYPNSFQLTINNQAQPRYNNSRTPRTIVLGQRSLTVQFSVDKTSNAYNAFNQITSNQADQTLVIAMVVSHFGTGGAGTNTTVSIAFDRLHFDSDEEQHPLDNQVTITANLDILKPNTTDNEIDITYGTS